MMHIYEAPCAEVINLAAMESIALLDGHPHEKVTRSKDDTVFDGSFSVGKDEPDF